VALLGGGKMGAAFAGGLLEADFDAADLAVAEVDADRRRDLESRFPDVRIVPSVAWAVADADVVVVCLKPGDVAEALDAAGAALGEAALVLSIAAGVTIAALEAAAPGRPVVRAMPNTPATIGLGAAAIAAGTHANDGHLDLAERLLGSLGLVVRLPEHLLDAVTGLSGSGPAYLFLVAEALVEAGVLVGLPRPVATKLVNQTLLGASTLLAQGDEGPEALRAAVTSPGGTTAAGLRSLEAHSSTRWWPRPAVLPSSEPQVPKAAKRPSLVTLDNMDHLGVLLRSAVGVGRSAWRRG
jgi:pyrroline-5-carboxylate reductase